jgi:hypothetical protein
LSPAVQEAVRIARDLLTSQLGLSVPVLLWILLTFRKKDFRFSPKPGKKTVAT